MARVLFVEDEVALRSALSSYLRLQGVDVVEAGSFSEGRERLEESGFDMLITDQELGDGHGSNLARSFLASFEGHALLATASAGVLDGDLSANERFEVWSKPVRPAQLFAWVAEHTTVPTAAAEGGFRELWSSLIEQGWAAEEVDRILLVLLDVREVRVETIRREGERLCIVLEDAPQVEWSRATRQLGIDTWLVSDELGKQQRIILLPLPWLAQRQRGCVLDLAGCESWPLERIESALLEARERRHRVVNLCAWHRLGLELLGRRDLLDEVMRVDGVQGQERRMLWSDPLTAKEVSDGRN
jgi:CheY-like chemotaxis protein